jgi:hypothetical protein
MKSGKAKQLLALCLHWDLPKRTKTDRDVNYESQYHSKTVLGTYFGVFLQFFGCKSA